MPQESASAASRSRELLWHLALLLVTSVIYESLFLHHGLNRLDESWPLYSAMRLHAGGTLYQDVLWVFPPAHVLPAWIAWALAPPGFVASRAIYAGFDVALVVGLYFLARRLMPAPFALAAGMLVALAAPRGHLYQVLFGYRYLVFAIGALLFFARGLRDDRPRWMALAGACTGIALVFRLTPAFSVACGVALGIVMASRDWRRWLRDGTAFSAGLLAMAIPVVVGFGVHVGFDTLWQEIVVHPLAMLQPRPPPPVVMPTAGDRKSLYDFFIAFQFRVYWLLFGAYALALGWRYVRNLWRREPFRHALLAAFVLFAAIFFIRSLGRSDEPHLDSTIPPILVLLAHASWRVARVVEGSAVSARMGYAVGAFLVAGWVYLMGVDLYRFPDRLGVNPVHSIPRAVRITEPAKARQVDRTVALLREHTAPEDVILNMGPTPLFHVLSGRTGPGFLDVVMPGIFLTEQDELGFVERLAADPPAAVVWPERDFDDMPERSVRRVAPHLSRWVLQRYRPVDTPQKRWIVLIPRR